jgi:hypothetical protein
VVFHFHPSYILPQKTKKFFFLIVNLFQTAYHFSFELCPSGKAFFTAEFRKELKTEHRESQELIPNDRYHYFSYNKTLFAGVRNISVFLSEIKYIFSAASCNRPFPN